MTAPKQLHYPHDRFNGYVQLSCNGQLFVPDKRPSGDTVGDAMKYSGAFLVLARRLDNMIAIPSPSPDPR